jgi:hypothetical protein
MLPIIAMTTMLIDHIGMIFFPHNEMYRIVGRIAFPLYCWFLVQGYLHTRNLGRYMGRLLLLACLSQIPYTLATRHFELNVIFTLLLALIGLYAAERVRPEGWKTAAVIGVLAAALYIPMDYGLYGVLLVFLYRYLDRWRMIVAHLLLNAAFLLLIGPGYWLQLFSILGTLLIAYPPPYRFSLHGRWIYRSFYPVHLAVLYLIYLWSKQP